MDSGIPRFATLLDDRDGPDVVISDMAAGVVRTAFNDGGNQLIEQAPISVGTQPAAIVITDFDR